VIGNDRWGNSERSLALVEEARERGIDAMSDVYPYTASSTGINILFPAWSKEGSRQERVARLRDPEKRLFIRNDIVEHLKAERGGDPSTIFVANCSWNRDHSGKSLADILTERGREVNLVNAAELAMELEEKGGCMGVFHSMSEDDVQRIMKHPTSMIASDGGIPAMGQGAPHPRNYGTFARVLARYVRELEVLSLEEAIYKMSGLPAARLGLPDRGVLREGAVADLVVFDPATIQDHATFEEPHQYATGAVDVFVGGQAVLLDSTLTGARPGKVLRKGQ
jgi:dihydroorotase/N-acyl-D-amino-acid deacylase